MPEPLMFTIAYETINYITVEPRYLELAYFELPLGVVRSGNGVVYLTSPGRPTEIGLQLGKACYPCSR